MIFVAPEPRPVHCFGVLRPLADALLMRFLGSEIVPEQCLHAEGAESLHAAIFHHGEGYRLWLRIASGHGLSGSMLGFPIEASDLGELATQFEAAGARIESGKLQKLRGGEWFTLGLLQGFHDVREIHSWTGRVPQGNASVSLRSMRDRRGDRRILGRYQEDNQETTWFVLQPMALRALASFLRSNAPDPPVTAEGGQ